MESFKEIWGLRNLRLYWSAVVLVIVLSLLLAGRVDAETCITPTRPFVPSDPNAAQEFRNLIRQDFENYIQDVQEYFRCLDQERTRAFDEAREVSVEYGLFLETIAQ
ncbi:MAG: hypothetical protein ACI90E_002016 [Yoonia sp.]|mgnify:CR=1|jgi:hypothetical protein